jgi:ganglioside GM2 activator
MLLLLSGCLSAAVCGMLLPNEHLKNLKVEHFSWKTCGTSADSIQIASLSLSPDPITVGKAVSITASGVNSVQIDSPLQVDVVVQKKVFVWITLPCVENLGSCNYTNICDLLPPPPCPLPFQQQRIPCTCPFPAGTYNVNNLPLDLTSAKIHYWISEGDFKAHVVLRDGDNEILCLDLEMSIVGKKDAKQKD